MTSLAATEPWTATRPARPDSSAREETITARAVCRRREAGRALSVERGCKYWADVDGGALQRKGGSWLEGGARVAFYASLVAMDTVSATALAPAGAPSSCSVYSGIGCNDATATASGGGPAPLKCYDTTSTLGCLFGPVPGGVQSTTLVAGPEIQRSTAGAQQRIPASCGGGDAKAGRLGGSI
jgi:hypothetical protein